MKPKKYILQAENNIQCEVTGFGDTSIDLVSGELVFNTSMCGYQELITDPSYNQQIVIMTFPLQGIYGINKHDSQSDHVEIASYVTNTYEDYYNDAQDVISLSEYLKQHHVLGVAGADTRYLTKQIRNHGCLKGIIYNPEVYTQKEIEQKIKELTLQEHVDKLNRTKVVKHHVKNAQQHFILYDLGIKQNIIKELNKRGISVTVVPYSYTYQQVKSLAPYDAIFFSNGPGDPSHLTNLISEIKKMHQAKECLLGICLGFQLIALAMGAKVMKMKFGHHGINQTVKDLAKNKNLITSQNHNYVVTKDSLPSDITSWFHSVNDDTLQGFTSLKHCLMAVQFHPESAPGPHDSLYVFDEMIAFASQKGSKHDK